MLVNHNYRTEFSGWESTDIWSVKKIFTSRHTFINVLSLGMIKRKESGQQNLTEIQVSWQQVSHLLNPCWWVNIPGLSTMTRRSVLVQFSTPLPSPSPAAMTHSTLAMMETVSVWRSGVMERWTVKMGLMRINAKSLCMIKATRITLCLLHLMVRIN